MEVNEIILSQLVELNTKISLNIKNLREKNLSKKESLLIYLPVKYSLK